MAIDPVKAASAQLAPLRSSWTARDVQLYHLGVGAGQRDVTADLGYLYEQRLSVLPTFAVLGGMAAIDELVGLPGLDIDPMRILHGEHDLVLHRPVPVEGAVTRSGGVVGVQDKGSAALLTLETTTHDDAGVPLATNTIGVFVRDEGGFAGDDVVPPARPPVRLPDREPDHVVDSPTVAWQAALYRLSGDLNPIHIDPDVAAANGFDTPLLHGMCTLGVATKAVVDTVLSGRTEQVRRVRTRFTGAVVPGDTLRTEMWRDGSRTVFRTTAVERDARVLGPSLLQTGGDDES